MEELLRVKMEFKKYSLKIRQCRDRCRWAVLPAVRPQHERAGDREDEDRHVEGHRVAPDVERAGDLTASSCLKFFTYVVRDDANNCNGGVLV